MRLSIPAILLTFQQARNQQSQRMLREFIRCWRHTHNGAQRLHAVVHRSNARTQPDRVRRGLDKLGIEDDELGSAKGCLEAIFAAGIVLRTTGEIGVFTRGEGSWHGDYRDGGWVDLGSFAGSFGEGFEVRGGVDLVGEGLEK